jgi:hypothetical protein
VPNAAAHAEFSDAERRRHHVDAEHVLELALPLLEQAAGSAVEGSVSPRHDPVDAIEEALNSGGDFQEVILSTLPRHVSSWVHARVPERIAHHGLEVHTVVALGRG